MRIRRIDANTVSRSYATLALRLRRIPVIHRPIRWMRRTFFGACWEGILEFSRWLWLDSKSFGPPIKTFSALQALRTGVPRIRGRLLLQDQGWPVVSEKSLMVNGGYNQHTEQPWPIFWSEHPNARLVASSLAMMADGKKLCVESVYGLQRLRHDPASRFFRLPPTVRLTHNWTSIVSRWVPTGNKLLDHPNYTHWILDSLPRLAVLSEFPSDTRIIVPARLHANQKESLALLGVLDRCRFTSEHHLEIERFYFSSPTAMLQCYNPYGINFLRQAFLPKRDQSFSTPKRFFIRRIGFTREPQNIAVVEKLFEELGWMLVDVMKLNFARQVQLFSEADAIAGMFGSAYTNCVFCRPGCKVVAIMPEEYGLDGYQEWIAQVVRFDWHPIFIPGSYTYRFSVDLELVKRSLASFGLTGK